MINIIKSVSAKYSKMSIVAKAGAWFTMCNFFQRGITMITTPVFTRVLPTEEYGLVNTFGAWQGVLALFVTLSLFQALMNIYIKHEDKKYVFSVVNTLSLVFTISWLAIYLFFSKQISTLLQLPHILTTCLFISFIGQSAIQNWTMYKRYVYEYKNVVVVTLLMTTLSAGIGMMCVLFFSKTAEARLIPQTIITFIIGIIIYIYSFKKQPSFYDKDIWKFTISFSIALLPHYLSEFILQSSDKLMINYMCGATDVAIYSVAYAAGSLILLLTSSINSVFAPYQFQKIKSGEYTCLSKTANCVLLFLAVILAVIMLFSREIVLIFGGNKYIESVEVIIPICIGVYFNYQFQLFARVQQYYNRKLTIVIPSILCALLNIILNYIFIKMYSYKAASYTTFICYMVFCFVHYLFYRKVMKEELNGINIYNIKGILLISIGVIASGFVISAISQILWLKYSIIGVLITLLIIFMKVVW